MPSWTRRSFLAGAAAIAAPVRRPNILLLLGDNWAAPHASALGDPVVRTNTFDTLALEGALFTHAFAPNPSCSPSRSSLLTGRETHRLGTAASLYGLMPSDARTYTAELEKAGYFVGLTGKGWGPGIAATQPNPAGKTFASFDAFLAAKPADAPFCFWFGSHDPHVPWNRGDKSGLNAAAVKVPAHLPDSTAVRDDMLGYYAEVEQFDRECGELVSVLRKRGELDNTLVVMTSDNGWQLPRGLATCYDLGVRIPMAMRWPARVKKGVRRDDFVAIGDLAATFLDAAGIGSQPGSLLKMGRRQEMFVERERHANVRKGDLSYPVRGIRTKRYLYLRNLTPDRWPAGDPEFYWAVGPYGDVDDSASKRLLLDKRPAPYFGLCFGKRPAEELYDLATDPDQVKNVASAPEMAKVKRDLAARVERWMKETNDPRAEGWTEFWDRAPYSGPKFKGRPID